MFRYSHILKILVRHFKAILRPSDHLLTHKKIPQRRFLAWLNAAKLVFFRTAFFGQTLVLSVLKTFKENGFFFARKNKNYSSCYKQEWELIGSYFSFFAYFSLFWLFQLILAYLETMVLIFTVVLISTQKLTRNKNHRFFGSYFWEIRESFC